MALAIVFIMTTACTSSQQETLGKTQIPGGGVRKLYRVWQSWDEMKEVLGDHYLYPTYLPEFTQWSEQPFMRSWFNSTDRELGADELFYGYDVSYWGGRKDDIFGISATDYGRRRSIFDDIMQSLEDFNSLHGEPLLYERFNSHAVIIGGIEIIFFSMYRTLTPPQGTTDLDAWYTYQPRNYRRVHFAFTIDAVTYEASWTQHNIEDRYADDESREGLLRIAKSIIEQVREIE